MTEKWRNTFRLDPRSQSILESVRDENLLPSLNTAINFLIRDYRRLQSENSRLNQEAKQEHDSKVTAKVASAKA